MRHLWLSGRAAAEAGPGEPDAVIAVLFEIPVREGCVTFVAAEDGTASMYTSRGGGIIGMGFHASTAAAALALVGCAINFAPHFPLATDFPLPPREHIAFHIVTRGGIHSTVIRESFLANNPRLAPLVAAKDQLVTRSRLLDERRQSGNLGPQDLDVQVLPDGGACVLIPPEPTPLSLTSSGLARVLVIAHANKDRVRVFVNPGDSRLQQNALAAIHGSPHGTAYSEGRKIVSIRGGGTTLHDAAAAGRVDIAREQMAIGAPLEARDENGYTPLLIAALLGQTGVARALVTGGADARTRDIDGNTTLIYAAQIGDLGAAKLFVESGVNPAHRGQNGLTALKVAKQNGFAKVADYLASLGAPE